MKLTPSILFLSILFGSGAFDNGSSTGKGKFQLDLTWNPFDKIRYGQTYAVLSYGITEKLDIHGYISQHPGPYHTWYAGLFYQFFKSKKIDLATAIGFRKQFKQKINHLFLPQLLYTLKLNQQYSIGGSLVNINDNGSHYGVSKDIALFYKFKYETKLIKSISISAGLFQPAKVSNNYFLPTYSIDIKFK